MSEEGIDPTRENRRYFVDDQRCQCLCSGPTEEGEETLFDGSEMCSDKKFSCRQLIECLSHSVGFIKI